MPSTASSLRLALFAVGGCESVQHRWLTGFVMHFSPCQCSPNSFQEIEGNVPAAYLHTYKTGGRHVARVRQVSTCVLYIHIVCHFPQFWNLGCPDLPGMTALTPTLAPPLQLCGSHLQAAGRRSPLTGSISNFLSPLKQFESSISTALQTQRLQCPDASGSSD